MENFASITRELESRLANESDKRIIKSLEGCIKFLKALDAKQAQPSSLADHIEVLQNQLKAPLNHRQLNKLYSTVVQAVQKEHGLVTPNYYQTLWMVLGMTVFGLPFGMLFGLALDNMAFFTIGLPIGMPIGMAIGMAKDKQAMKEGRVLVFE